MCLRNNNATPRRLRALAIGLSVLAAMWPEMVGADLCVCPGVDAHIPTGAGTQVCPYADFPNAQEKGRNAEAQKLKNPEPKNAESVEMGKKLYQRFCASCHGPQGKGDGGMALSGGTPSDLTDETWDYGSTDGEIFAAIRDGVSSDMLAYKEKLSEKQIWQLVNYIRNLGPKPKEDK